MCFADPLGRAIHKKTDTLRTRMWDKLGFTAFRDPLAEKFGAASKYTNADSTKNHKALPGDFVDRVRLK